MIYEWWTNGQTDRQVPDEARITRCKLENLGAGSMGFEVHSFQSPSLNISIIKAEGHKDRPPPTLESWVIFLTKSKD